MPGYAFGLHLVIRGLREFRWWIVDNRFVDDDRSAIETRTRRATAKDQLAKKFRHAHTVYPNRKFLRSANFYV